MHQCFFYCHSLFRWPSYHLLHKVNKCWRSLCCIHSLWKRKLCCLSWKQKVICSFTFIKKVLWRLTQSFFEHLDLLLLVSGGKQRSTGVNLKSQAACAPHINFLIVGLDQNDLRRAIISWLNVSKLFFVNKTSRSKIHQFHTGFSFLFENYILWFNVTMDNLFMMQEE